MVFFMQAGFAMVETGFARAKNAGNIIMKNLMDFCIGTVVFMLLGYGLMMGEDALAGLVGIPNLDLFGKFTEFIASPEEGLTEACSRKLAISPQAELKGRWALKITAIFSPGTAEQWTGSTAFYIPSFCLS